MLILVAVTVRTVIQSGLFGHASKATNSYSMHEAREQLGTTLAGAQAEKYTNKDYDEDDFLTEYIKDNLPGSKVAGDVILVGDWAFEIDRTVPKIVKDLGKGKPEDFIQPELTVIKGTLADDKLSIPLNITALEATNGISEIEVYKYGETTPLETFTCSNEKTTVNKTFMATENAKYKIVAHSKLRATKSIEVTEIIAPTLQTGSYVRYTPEASDDYIMPIEVFGSSQEIIPQDNTLKWQLLNMNFDGTIDLISDKVISTEFTLRSSLCYNNGVYLLNDLCKSQYSNTNLGAVGRSINLVDIEQHFNDRGISSRNSYSTYGKSTACASGYTCTPDIYKNHDKNVTTTPNNIAKMESENYYSTFTNTLSTSESNLTITQTYYDITSLTNFYDDPNFHNLIFGTGSNFWLATRFVYANATPQAKFGLRIVSGSQINGHMLVESGVIEGPSAHCGVRPVVKLPAKYTLQHVSGTNEWEIVEK